MFQIPHYGIHYQLMTSQNTSSVSVQEFPQLSMCPVVAKLAEMANATVFYKG
jgi:hypothetical protein